MQGWFWVCPLLMLLWKSLHWQQPSVRLLLLILSEQRTPPLLPLRLQIAHQKSFSPIWFVYLRDFSFHSLTRADVGPFGDTVKDVVRGKLEPRIWENSYNGGSEATIIWQGAFSSEHCDHCMPKIPVNLQYKLIQAKYSPHTLPMAKSMFLLYIK